MYNGFLKFNFFKNNTFNFFYVDSTLESKWFTLIYLNSNNIKHNVNEWVEIWNIDSRVTNLELINDLPWNFYLKYKLSMINSWHILEERFLIFFLIFIICFF